MRSRGGLLMSGRDDDLPPDRRPTKKLSPLRPPRPTGPANRAIVEHQAIVQRQSDHEFKVNGDLQAVANYLKRRESFEHDLAVGLTVVARELGVEERMPTSLTSLAPPPPRAVIDPKHPLRLPPPPKSTTPIHVSARKSSQAAHATYGVIGLLVVEIAIQILKRL